MDNNKARELAAQAAKYAIKRMEGVTVDATTWREKYENIITFEVRKALETYAQEAEKWGELVERQERVYKVIRDTAILLSEDGTEAQAKANLESILGDACPVRFMQALARAEKMGVE